MDECRSQNPTNEPGPKRIFVSNIHPLITEEDLYKLFSCVGELQILSYERIGETLIALIE